MFGRMRILLTVAALTLAMPAGAQTPAPANTAFDGTYLGVSVTFEESVIDGRKWIRSCPQFGRPKTLTIVNGIAREDTAEGSVGPQGLLVMRDFWSHFDGRIDSQGIVRARATGGCNYQLVWQKVSPSTMPFDGDYIGVSRESSGGWSAECPPNGLPVTLFIRNGVVTGGSWQGSVNPRGAFVMGNRLSPRVDGQADNQGVMRGQGSNAAGCVITFVWRKQAG
jgi:hypothetical protein